MKRHLGTLLFTLAVAASGLASAGLVVVEADDYAAGTDISNAVAGVTLSAFGVPGCCGLPLTSNLVRSLVATNPSGFGARSFGVDAAGFRTGFFTGDHLFRADFSSPVQFVSILVGPDFESDTSDPARIEVYGVGDVLLGSFDTSGGLGTVAFNRPSAEILYLIARNPSGAEGQSFSLDHLAFQVPEPSTLLLGLAGMSGLALRRRKSTT